MQIKEFDLILDIKKRTEQEQFEVVQGDSLSNKLNISLVDGLKPYDLTGAAVEIVFSKEDGTTVQQTTGEDAGVVIVNATEGKIQCLLKTNTIACPGKIVAEVRILSDEILLTSATFGFFVRKALLNDETIESTNEFPVLQQLIIETNGLIEQVNQIEKQVPENVVERIDSLELNKINISDITQDDAVNDETKVPSSMVTYQHGQAIRDKIDKANIVQTDTVDDETKIPSAKVAYNLGKEIDEINNNLAWGINAVFLGAYPNLDNIGEALKPLIARYHDSKGYHLIISFFYLVDGKKYGTQLDMNYFEGIKFRVCNNNVWSAWVAK